MAFDLFDLARVFYIVVVGFLIVVVGLTIAAILVQWRRKSFLSSQICGVCSHQIGKSSVFYTDPKIQEPSIYFHESCYREISRGQRRRCLNCNRPLYNPKSKEFVVPVVLKEGHQLFCSAECAESYKPLAGLAFAPPTQVTCHYCGKIFPSSSTTCPQCGASRPKISINEMLGLSPSEFEQKIAELLNRMGYSQIVRTGGAGDRAVDVTAQRKDELGHVLRYAVQCKRYEPSSPVGSTEMQVFCSMMSRVHGSDRGIYVTTSSFTTEAQAIAEKFNVTLVDGKLLEELITQYG